MAPAMCGSAPVWLLGGCAALGGGLARLDVDMRMLTGLVARVRVVVLLFLWVVRARSTALVTVLDVAVIRSCLCVGRDGDSSSMH